MLAFNLLPLSLSLGLPIARMLRLLAALQTRRIDLSWHDVEGGDDDDADDDEV